MATLRRMDGYGHIEDNGCSRGGVEDGETHLKRQKVVKYVDWEYQRISWWTSTEECDKPIAVVEVISRKTSRIQVDTRYKTGWEETEPTRQLCIFGWSGLRRRQHGDENSQENGNGFHN